MDRRKFLALASGILTLPSGLREAATAFAKSCEEKQDLKRTLIIDVTYTNEHAFVTYADGSYKLGAPDERF
jgi:hypothetical protein